MTEHTKEIWERVVSDVKGKVVDNLEYDEEGKYLLMSFTDGTVMSFRYIAELLN